MRTLAAILAKSKRKSILLTLTAFIGLLTLIGFGLLLSNTYGASQVADNARNLHWTNKTKAVAALTRASVGQAVFFSHPEVSNDDTKTEAIDEALGNLTEAENAIGDTYSTRDIDAALSAYIESARETVDLALAGQVSRADLHRTTSDESLFVELVAALAAKQSSPPSSKDLTR